MPDDDADTLTIGQVAKMLNVSRTTLREWDKSGKLPAHRLPVHRGEGPGHRRWRREQIEAILTRSDNGEVA